MTVLNSESPLIVCRIYFLCLFLTVSFFNHFQQIVMCNRFRRAPFLHLFDFPVAFDTYRKETLQIAEFLLMCYRTQAKILLSAIYFLLFCYLFSSSVIYFPPLNRTCYMEPGIFFTKQYVNLSTSSK